MIKSILISVNILGLILLGAMQKNAIEATQDIPDSLEPGQEAVVTVEIDKSDVSGFAKFQITLDEGLKAQVVESAGASFTFKDQKGKFIWMSLPSDKKFTLKYRIVASSEASGNLKVSSRFSYIYKNERKNFDLPVHEIGIGGAAVASTEPEPAAEESMNENATASAERLITSVGINQWEVEVVVDKTDLQGFAKIEENIPQGYTALDLNSNGAVFSLNDQTVKYIWSDIPQTEKVRVQYKLLPVVAMDGNMPRINGVFSFPKGEENMEIPISEGTPDVMVMNTDTAETESEPEEVAEEMETPEPEPTPEPVAEPVAVPVVVPVAVESTEEEVTEAQPEPKPEPTPQPEPEEPITAEKNPIDGNIIDVPMPETGVYYRVQIAAGKNNLKRDEFTEMFAFYEEFKLESIDGWFKYTTGHHQVYKSARDDRTRITQKYTKFNGPFVTAYNSGERITVQEALMITSQKWYP